MQVETCLNSLMDGPIHKCCLNVRPTFYSCASNKDFNDTIFTWNCVCDSIENTVG